MKGLAFWGAAWTWFRNHTAEVVPPLSRGEARSDRRVSVTVWNVGTGAGPPCLFGLVSVSILTSMVLGRSVMTSSALVWGSAYISRVKGRVLAVFPLCCIRLFEI